MRVLGIESSCDETSAAVVLNGDTLLSCVTASSLDLHSVYGGVIPEIAARSHIESIIPVIDQALTEAATAEHWTGDPWERIDAIAVTKGAGLIGSLMVGLLSARAIAYSKNKPLYGVNHVEGHVYANFITKSLVQGINTPTTQPTFPLLALIVSGGHTQLALFTDHFNYRLLGQTQDDAIGEAFDKVAKIIGLPYPGGISLSKLAPTGNNNAYQLPKSKLKNRYDFSFSGLKTAVLRSAQAAVGADFRLSSTLLPNMLNDTQKADIAASFQKVAIETVVDKTILAFNEFSPASVVIAGGVAANTLLRAELEHRLPLPIQYADPSLCTDNGAMIATLGCFKAMAQVVPDSPFSLSANPVLSM